MRDVQTRVSRRRTVAAVAGGIATGLAGCQGLLGAIGGTGPTESFEDGLAGSIFTDTSQESVSPAVSSEHATHGDRSLLLESDPGTATANAVRSEQTWTGAHRYSVAVKPVEVGGDENGIAVHLLADESERSLRFHSSPWHDTARVVETDDAGDEREDGQTAVGDLLTPGEWSSLAFEVRADGASVTVGEETTELDVAWDVAADPVRLRLHANGWGSGDPVTAAFDEVRVESL